MSKPLRKHHRQQITRTHGDKVTESSWLVRHEAIVEVGIYEKKRTPLLAPCSHIQVSWDPSSYGLVDVGEEGKIAGESLVAAVYSHQADLAAYLPLQEITKVRASHLLDDLATISRAKELTRLEGFAEIRALSHALEGVGKTLSSYLLDADLALALSPGVDINTRLPDGLNLAHLDVLTSVSDQGPLNMSALNYLQFKLPMLLWVMFDPFHRAS